ncbi:hypothetical protein GGQ80_001882 [Sphingomonas jinjuensis]|uniref:Uncharacterized protein n=1 Tax=Sphingomonas jinjuensis TaxID=535907 RepID=A0A840FCJ7_9SPHN|nr:hypothetical protein [Sphingomonas jinjuensis]MBB4153976.1 hypothetical protein [Sphingomonas jinjuensis]
MSVFVAQLVMGIAGLFVVAAWPPATGRMMLVSLNGAGVNALVVEASAAGAQVVGPGPVPGSLVVSGDRSRILAHIGHWHTLVLAPAAAGCAAGLDGQSVA